MRRRTIRIAVIATAAVTILAAAYCVLAPAAPGEHVLPSVAAPGTQAPSPPSAAGSLSAPPVAAARGAEGASEPAESPGPRDTGCVIVSLKRTPTPGERERLGVTGGSIVRGGSLYLATPPAGMTASEYSEVLAGSDLVEYAEPDYVLTPASAPYTNWPNDTDFTNQTTWVFGEGAGAASVPHAKSWGLRGPGSSNFDQVWPALATAEAGPGRDKDVHVAVIDTGFYFEGHPDLGDAGNIRAAIDECQGYWPDEPAASRLTTDTDVTPVGLTDEDQAQATAHGTMVASQIGQGTGNFTGSSGAAWDTSVDVYKIQGVVMEGHDAGEIVMPDSALLRAIYDAVDDAHAKGYRLVINMSLVEHAGSAGSTSMRNAIAYARRADHDVVIVAAAGNDGASVVSYPAAYDGVIAVGASIISGTTVKRASFSNRGSKLDILAPGEFIWGPVKPGTIKTLPGTITPDPDGVVGYDWWNGTSMSAPYVASAAALLLRVEPSLTATEVETYLTRNASEMGVIGRDNDTGWGQLDVYAAYQALVTPVTTVQERPAYVPGATITFDVTDRDSGSNVTTYHRLDASWDAIEGSVVTLTLAPGNVGHTLEYWSVDSNGVAEEPKWFAFQVLEPDVLSPITSSDLVESYAGQARVELSAHDPSPGWIGRDFPLSTYYRLDAGVTVAGDGLLVGSSGLHTLRFWSVDYAGNVETQTVATFTITPLPTKVTLSRSAGTIRRGSRIRLSGTLSPARAGDTVSIQVKTPGSRTWKNFTGYMKYYKRGVATIDAAGRGTWSSLSYALNKRGRHYFRVVYSGDTKNLSRKSATSNTVSVLVK